MRRAGWALCALVLVGCSAGETYHETQAVDIGSFRTARMTLAMNAGELAVSGGASKLMDGDFRYNADRLKPIVERRTADDRLEVTVSQEKNSSAFSFGSVSSSWDLRLSDRVPLDLLAHLGAGEAHLTLGSLNLQRLEVGIGAGEVHVDLRGTPRSSYMVEINGGVGEAVVMLPRTVGISATASGGIGEVNVSGLEKRGDRWVNAGHESDPVQITVDVKGGVGEIRLSAE